MRTLRSLLLPLLVASTLAHAQDYAVGGAPAAANPAPPGPKKDPRPLKDRVWFGGGVSLMFGTVTNLGVAPMMGYKIDQKGKWSAGLGVNYYYFSDSRYQPAYESSNYGGSLFTRYRVIPQAYLHAEYNLQNYELYSPFNDVERREWVPFLLLGGGYAQHLGGHSYMTFQVLWDVIQDVRSPYGSQPFFTAGVGVGF
ncbi:MAG: hypothetical protein JNL05_13395 [Flavobacteriales bacterium]|nr:hypothetical protein [Flavobacteriales bacterium]